MPERLTLSNKAAFETFVPPGDLVAIGLQPVPIPTGYKYPKGYNNWKDTDFSSMANKWPKNCGIGLKCGELLGLDIDVYHRPVVVELWRHIRNSHPHIVGRIGQPPKILIPFCCEEITGKLVSNRWIDQDGVINAVEVLADGQQFVAFGIHPDTKKPYTWTGDFLEHPMPRFTLNDIENLFSIFDSLASTSGWTNLSQKETKAAYKPREITGDAPGDIYNRSTKITDCLREYGWRHYHGKYWTRPGKKTGVSASVMDGFVYIFTSSTSLEPDRTYDCFGLLAHYEFNNDFSAAAKAISKLILEAT